MEDIYRYAIGQQDFKVLREGGAHYVDKTAFIEKILRSNIKYYFLARPRRFGKSLFLSTLRYFFEGRRYLFEGLDIASSDWDWEEYPVLRLDLKVENENNFQNIFYVLTTLTGIDAKAEAHTSAGRVDLLIETPEFIYIIELKYDSSPAVALRQIGERGYARKFAADPRRLFRIGAGFSSANRCIQAWEIESDN